MPESEKELAEQEIIRSANDNGGLPFADTTMSISAQAPAELQPGVILLEKFKIIELLGLGGMGSVYRVDHLFMNQQYALKCLNKCQRNDINWRRFENEAKAANMLDHANLLRVFEFGLLPGGRPYFLMELVNGVTLADEVKRLGRLPMKRAIKIFIQVAFAIHYAHEHKVIHRDLKPSNIMLEKKPEEPDIESVKVVDFGIAKLTGVDEFNQQTLTKTGEIFGSPLYMSPEQCVGTTVDHRTDLYALGCLFFESLTGAPPFIGESALATMMKHQGEAPLSLKEASMGIGFPLELERIVAKLLEKDPNNRYQSAKALAVDLIELERALSGAAGEAASGVDTQKKENRKSGANHSFQLSQNTLLVGAVSGLIGAFVGAAICYGILSSQMNELRAQYQEQPPAIPTQTSNEENTKRPQAGSFSHIEGSERVFKFPPKVCLGTLIDEQGFVHQAEGEKRFPKTRQLALLVSNDSLESPELLVGLRPDDLVFLNFGPGSNFPPKKFSAIENLTSLKALNLNGTLFNDGSMASLEKLSNLRYLNFDTTSVDGAALTKLSILKNLNAIDVSNLSGLLPFCQKLSALPNLHELTMRHCKLDDLLLHAISGGQSIQVLCLSQNKDITDAGLSYIKEMKNLYWLDVSGTSISPNCLESLALIPSLKKLELGNLRWTAAQRKDFSKDIKSKLPGIQLFWDDQETSDLKTTMPEFTWKGGALK